MASGQYRRWPSTRSEDYYYYLFFFDTLTHRLVCLSLLCRNVVRRSGGWVGRAVGRVSKTPNGARWLPYPRQSVRTLTQKRRSCAYDRCLGRARGSGMFRSSTPRCHISPPPPAVFGGVSVYRMFETPRTTRKRTALPSHPPPPELHPGTRAQLVFCNN